MTRRDFIQRSAEFTAALTPIRSAMGALNPPVDTKAELSLFLPPLLSCPTGSSIRISACNAEHAVEALIELRRTGAADWERRQPPLHAGAHELLNWQVGDLSPAAPYDYRILLRRDANDSLRQVAAGSFTTQRTGPARYTAILMTDPHTGYFPLGSGPAVTLDKVVQNVSRAKPEFVLDLGDTVAWPGSREYPQKNHAGALAAYGQYRRQIGPLSGHTPLFSVIGNWAGESGKFPEKSIQTVATVRRALLPNPNQLTYPQGGSEWEDYYAFAWGDALYVILNIQTYSKPSQPDRLPSLMSDVNRIEEWTLGEKQMAWLESTLNAATERFRFLCIHHPAGGNAGDALNTGYGRGGARAWNTGEQIRIHNLMKQHKVQVFFYGHDHVFVDDVVDGIHYTLPGSCGAPWKFTKQETGYERFWPDSGHAQLDITPEKATVTFINLEGKDLHSFSVAPV